MEENLILINCNIWLIYVLEWRDIDNTYLYVILMASNDDVRRGEK